MRAVARTGGRPAEAAGREGEPGRVNRPLLAALGELGLLERVFASGALELCLLRESLAYGCTEAETALALQGLGAYPVLRAGSEAQRERWLPQVRSGRAVAAFALSEPGAGSDAAALALAATPIPVAAGGSAARSAGSPTRPRRTSTPCSPVRGRGRGPMGCRPSWSRRTVPG